MSLNIENGELENFRWLWAMNDFNIETCFHVVYIAYGTIWPLSEFKYQYSTDDEFLATLKVGH